ncbi:MFS transporter [Luteipulveratus sp. YIM 133132]|uniref:MFS transporter n=1 Tax=Luteipulveratus flavus TaxID=3031728 RepID=UPI0023B18181|nr:MFS transporter [Luteipulveratus sp. YIM 133132]MDE9366870.1 MFS transporter [Luteipulveratus sp. YIM 133132]
MTTTHPSTAMSRRQLLVLGLLLASQFMLAVDFSILNVALPTVGAGLGFAEADLQWIATAFGLCAAGFTLLFGRFGDYVGRRRMFLIGMAALGIASLVGGLATSPAVLLTARVAQGLATAAVTPAGLSLLTTSFPEGPLRAKALGLNSVMMSTGFTAGAILGGVLTDLLSWRWAFLVNVPVAALVVVLAPMLLTDSADREHSRLDVLGSVLVTTGLLSLVYGVTRAGEYGPTDPWAGASVLLAIVLLAGFWQAERRHSHPLVPTAILRRRTIGWGNAAGFVTFAMESSLVFLLTLYLQHVLGLNPLQTGLTLGAMGLGAIIGGSVGPRVIATVGVRRSLAGGLLVQAVFTALLVALGPATGWIWLIVVATFLGAIGHVCVIVGFMVAATSGLPDHEQGLATGLATMTQQVGVAMGVPVMSAVATMAGSLESLNALRVAIAVDATVVAVAALLVATQLRTERPAAAIQEERLPASV